MITFDNGIVQLHHGSAMDMAFIPDASVDCVVTSQPYWGLRDYGLEPQIWDAQDGCVHEWGNPVMKPLMQGGPGKEQDYGTHDVQSSTSVFCSLCGAWRGTLGLEPTPQLYVHHMTQVFREVWRVLKPTGTVWLNLGDSYAGSGKGMGSDHGKAVVDDAGYGSKVSTPPGLKPKDLVGIPWRVAFALQEDGWWLRSDIIWAKPNPMPESVTDRPTKAHEYIFLLTKAEKYYYDAEAIKETGTGTEYDLTRRPESRMNGSKYLVEGKGQLETGSSFGQGTATRNKRTVWTISTQSYEGAHFATFPEALVEPCVLAGTSEKGNCAQCGLPWERVVEHTNMEWTKGNKRMHDDVKGRTRMGGTQEKPAINVTTGWQPSCECNAGTVPSVVLDPFSGSGTTCMVAQKLGRGAVGVDQSKDYLKLAEKRIGAVSLPMVL